MNVAMHHQQLLEHGGLSGLRDKNMLEAALGRPLNEAACGETDMVALAAGEIDEESAPLT